MHMLVSTAVCAAVRSHDQTAPLGLLHLRVEASIFFSDTFFKMYLKNYVHLDLYLNSSYMFQCYMTYSSAGFSCCKDYRRSQYGKSEQNIENTQVKIPSSASISDL